MRRGCDRVAPDLDGDVVEDVHVHASKVIAAGWGRSPAGTSSLPLEAQISMRNEVMGAFDGGGSASMSAQLAVTPAGGTLSADSPTFLTKVEGSPPVPVPGDAGTSSGADDSGCAVVGSPGSSSGSVSALAALGVAVAGAGLRASRRRRRA